MEILWNITRATRDQVASRTGQECARPRAHKRKHQELFRFVAGSVRTALAEVGAPRGERHRAGSDLLIAVASPRSQR
jgi:hypothetical protein